MTEADMIRRSRWLSRQPDALARALVSAGRVVTPAPGQWVYGEGDDEAGLAAVLRGSLRLEAAVGPRTVLVGIARAGATVGQSRRSGGGPRLVTARAGPGAVVLLIGDGALARVAAVHPDLWRSVSELVYAQLDAAVHALAQALALPPRARVAARLLALAQDGEVRLAQSDLAELCGLSRKAVNGWLGALEAAGAVARGYGHVMVRDAALLARLAE